MAVRPRNGGWQADVCWRGQRARAHFATRLEAEAWAAEATAALMRGAPVPPGGARSRAQNGTSGVTLGDAIEHCRATRWALKKSADLLVVAAAQAARYFGADRPIESIGTADLQRFSADAVKRGLSGARVNRILSALSAVMKAHAERVDWKWHPPRFPARHPENKGRQAVLSEADVSRIAAWLRSYALHEDADAVELLFYTGIRLGELEALRWQDVVFADEGGFLRLPETKNGDGRDVPLRRRAAEILTARRRDYEAGAERYPYHQRKGARVFPALRTWGLRRNFAKACKALGIEGDDLCLHTLRHSCGTHLRLSGVDPRDTARWMGHKTLAMVARYDHVMPGDMARAAALADA